MTNNTLTDLIVKYGSDKFGDRHNYTLIYEKEFDNIRSEVKNVLEVGLGTYNTQYPCNMGVNGKPGASLRAWRDYFANSNVYGLDIDKTILFEEERIKTYYCDQTNSSDIENLFSSKELSEIKFDIIIDDGWHCYHANYNFLTNAFKYLKTGGFFIIEDLNYNDAIQFSQNKENLKILLQYSDFKIYELQHPNNNYDNRLIVIKK